MKYTTSAEIREAAKGRPLCQWPGNKLTAVQVDALLGNMPVDLIINEGTRERIIKSLNDIQAIEDKPAPTRLPIDRPVRIKDVEVGDVLRYCGVVEDHESWPVVGSEVVVTGLYGHGLRYRCTTKTGKVVEHQCAPAHCIAQGFSFVRRPGFAKVRDGQVKNGDTVWWLCNAGPRQVTVREGNADWSNLKDYPQCYQIAEPKKVDGYDYMVRGINSLTTPVGEPL